MGFDFNSHTLLNIHQLENLIDVRILAKCQELNLTLLATSMRAIIDARTETKTSGKLLLRWHRETNVRIPNYVLFKAQAIH